MRWTRLAVMLAMVLAGCGGQAVAPDPPGSVPPSREAGEASRSTEPSGLASPPAVTVRTPDTTVTVPAHTYCFDGVCADGVPPAAPPHVGEAEHVVVDFPLPDWSFTAIFERVGPQCPRRQEVPLQQGSDGTHVLGPAGPADTYDVTLFGRGDGDLFATFRWSMPDDGPLPEPEARLAVLADNDGTVDSYGVELHVRNLARTPRDATAEVTVRVDDGASTTFAPDLATGPCRPEGTVYWDGPDEAGQTAAALGDGLFTYEVAVVLDGSRHTAIATWPDDVIEGHGPSVALEFEPPLPSLEP